MPALGIFRTLPGSRNRRKPGGYLWFVVAVITKSTCYPTNLPNLSLGIGYPRQALCRRFLGFREGWEFLGILRTYQNLHRLEK